MPKPPPVPKALKEATKGLVYVSESDSPVTAFAWPPGPITTAAVREQAGADEGVKVQEVSLAEVMRGVPTSERGNYFSLLVALLDFPSGIKAFKVGAVRTSLYIVGTTPAGHRAGVKTELVET